MNYKKVAELLGGQILISASSEQNISTVYAGDFLSRVISKAPRECVWLTIINNQNVAGVAVLADIPVVVLCEDVMPDQMLLNKAKIQDFTLIATSKSVFECCVLLGNELKS